MGIALGVVVSDTNGEGVEYHIRGVVDVPAPPFGDDERILLAKMLFHATNIPEKQKRRYALHDWVTVDGWSGIRVTRCDTIPKITDKDVIGDIRVSTPPNVEDVDERDQIGPEKHNEWVREYRSNRYCRYESREELNQRWQDIQVNTQVLNASGKMGLTTEEAWYRMGQHVIAEMLIRGEPPNVQNRDPRVQVARPFFDGELCREAANVVSSRGTGQDVVVKYGKHGYMKDLYEKGLVYMNAASDYDKSTYNQAIRDDERSIAIKGGYFPTGRPMQFYDKDTVPDDITEVAERDDAGFLSIYECPNLERRQYATVNIEMLTDYWMFCMADVLDQRRFADFEADCCVIIKSPLCQHD